MEQEHDYEGVKTTADSPGIETFARSTGKNFERSSVEIVERRGRTKNVVRDRVSLVLEVTFYPGSEKGRGDESPIPEGTAHSVQDSDLRCDGLWR